MSTPRRRAAGAVSLLLTLAIAATACTGDGGTSAGPDGDTSGSSAVPAPLKTTATMGRVTGRLARNARGPLKRHVRAVVDGWIDAAYVAGDYPRSDFKDAFPGFNKGAQAEARSDIDLMTNARLGARIDSVKATRRVVRVDVLAVRRKAVGVTARFALNFETRGEVERTQHVKGRLYLTRSKSGWQVFGYDVTKGTAR